jgi:glucose-6-phosphate 1-dehydrogenase
LIHQVDDEHARLFFRARAAARHGDFGGAGDLAARKPLPALYMAHLHSSLPPETRIITVGRSGWTRERYLTFELKHGDCDIDCASIERRLSPH